MAASGCGKFAMILSENQYLFQKINIYLKIFVQTNHNLIIKSVLNLPIDCHQVHLDLFVMFFNHLASLAISFYFVAASSFSCFIIFLVLIGFQISCHCHHSSLLLLLTLEMLYQQNVFPQLFHWCLLKEKINYSFVCNGNIFFKSSLFGL